MSKGQFNPPKPWLKEWYEWTETILVTVGTLLAVFLLVMRPATVNGPSMENTLHNGERLVLWQLGYHHPAYGDIVVVDRTQNQEPPIVKRVIGLPGDTIDIHFETGQVWRNGELLEETYIKGPTRLSCDIDFPVQVPEGCVFVMGDNRNNSLDSRSSQVGMVDERRVMGKAVVRFYPFHKVGLLLAPQKD